MRPPLSRRPTLCAIVWAAAFAIRAAAAAPSTPPAAADAPTTAPQPAAPDDAIIARVNGEALLLSHLREAALDQNVPLAMITSEGLRGEGYRRALTMLVDEALLVQAAQAEQIAPDPLMVARSVDQMLSRLRAQLGSEAALNGFLRQAHLDLDALRRMLVRREERGQMATQVVARRVTVDSATLERFIAERRRRGLPLEEALLAQILVVCPRAEQGTPTGNERLLRALRAARDAGAAPERFAELVDQYTDDPAGRGRGGLLGWIDPEALREPLRQTVRMLEVGQVSAPVATDDGYHVLRLLDRRSTRDLCFAEVFAQRRAELLEQLRRRASIQLFDLQGNPIPTRVEPVQADDVPSTRSATPALPPLR